MCICNIGDKIEVSKSSNYELKISGKFKDQLIGKKNIVDDVFFKLKKKDLTLSLNFLTLKFSLLHSKFS